MGAYDDEVEKWNVKRPFQEFPKALYRGLLVNGRPDTETRVVHDRREQDAAAKEGWVSGGPQPALEAFEQQQQVIAQAAAESAGDARKLSKKAQKERDEREAATEGHLTE